MRSFGGHRSWPNESTVGPPGDAAGAQSHHSVGEMSRFVTYPSRAQESATSGRRRPFLSGANAFPSRSTAVEIPSTLANHLPREGGGGSYYGPEARINSGPSLGSFSSRRREPPGFSDCSEGVLPRGSASAESGAFRSQGPLARPLPVMVPRGSSPFAAACAARSAMPPGDDGMPYEVTMGERAQSATCSRQAMRHFAPANPCDPLRSPAARITPSMFTRSAGQGLLTATTHEGSLPPRHLASRHSQPARRHVSLSREAPSPPGLQASHGYSTTSRQRANLERPASADQNRGGGPPLPTSSPDNFLGSNTGATSFDAFFGESVAARVHRSFAASMIRSFFSAVTSPVSASLRGPWGEEPDRIRGASSSSFEDEGVARRLGFSPHASFVVFATSTPDPGYSQMREYDLGRFMEELDLRLGFDDPEVFNGSIFLLVSGGEFLDADGVVPHILADATGTPVPLRQVWEARNLRSSLEQHAIKWTYGGSSMGSGTPDKDCPGNPVVAPASSSRKAADKERTLGVPTTTAEGASGAPGRCAQPQTQNGKECCICLSYFEAGDTLLTLRCLHIFHAECLYRWIKTSHNVKCPLCSTSIAEPPAGMLRV